MKTSDPQIARKQSAEHDVAAGQKWFAFFHRVPGAPRGSQGRPRSRAREWFAFLHHAPGCLGKDAGLLFCCLRFFCQPSCRKAVRRPPRLAGGNVSGVAFGWLESVVSPAPTVRLPSAQSTKASFAPASQGEPCRACSTSQRRTPARSRLRCRCAPAPRRRTPPVLPPPPGFRGEGRVGGTPGPATERCEDERVDGSALFDSDPAAEPSQWI